MVGILKKSFDPPTQCHLLVQLGMESFELFGFLPFEWPLQYSPLMLEFQLVVPNVVQSNSTISLRLFPKNFQPSTPTFQENNHLFFDILLSKGMVQVLKPHLQGLFYCLQPFSRLLTNVVNNWIEFESIASKCS
jgi:hypothetical protein